MIKAIFGTMLMLSTMTCVTVNLENGTYTVDKNGCVNY